MAVATPTTGSLPHYPAVVCLGGLRSTPSFPKGNIHVPTVLRYERPLVQRLADLQRQGLIVWSGRKLKPILPVAKVRGEGAVADLIISERG